MIIGEANIIHHREVVEAHPELRRRQGLIGSGRRARRAGLSRGRGVPRRGTHFQAHFDFLGVQIDLEHRQFVVPGKMLDRQGGFLDHVDLVGPIVPLLPELLRGVVQGLDRLLKRCLR